MIGVNVDLMLQTLKHITAHPEEWNQANWVLRSISPPDNPGDRPKWDCGTACCFAGTVAVTMLGNRPWWENDAFAHTAQVTLPDGTQENVSVVAAEALGIDRGDLDPMFDASNNLRDLWEYGRLYTDGAIEIPAEVLAIEPDQFTDRHEED